MPNLKHVQKLIQQGDYAFSIDLQDAYLHIPIVKHHHHFLHFVWHNVPSQWKVLPFGLATALRVFMSLTKPILFLCHHKGLHIVIYLDDISWSSFALCRWVRGQACFCVLCWSILVYISIFSSLTFASLRPLVSWGYTVCMSVSLPPDKLADIQQLALSLLWTLHVRVCQVMSF